MRECVGIVLQQLLCLLTILPGELIRILTLWQLYALNHESSLQQYLAVCKSRLLTCSITIVYHVYLLGVGLQQVYLVISKSGTATTHSILYAILGQRHHIKLAFYQVSKSFARYRLARLVQTKQMAPFGEQRRFACIQILGRLIIDDGLQCAATEAYHIATAIVEREHHAIAKRIIGTTLLILADTIHINHPIERVSLMGD